MRKRLAVALTAALLIGWQVRATPEGDAQFVSSTRWQHSEKWFGGFSGIELQDNGSDFVAISDRGQIVEGKLSRKGGQINDISVLAAHPILGLEGQVQKGFRRDTEGLAIRNDGRVYVSYEGNHRIWAYMSVGAQAAGLERHADFKSMRSNGSLEALAVDEKNRLYTLPEDPRKSGDSIPVYRYDNGDWSIPFSISKLGDYHSVGADFGPDGQLYLLERSFNGWSFKTRVRRFEINGSEISQGEMVLQTASGIHENLEGLSVWRDDQGQIRLTMISDDNFLFYLSTQIVEYVLPTDS